MTAELERLRRAEAQSEQARARLIGTLSEIQERLSPKTLMAEAREEFQQKAGELIDEGIAFVRGRPGTIGAILVGIIAWLLRAPILRALESAFAGVRRNRTGRSRVNRTSAAPAPGKYRTRSSDDDE